MKKINFTTLTFKSMAFLLVILCLGCSEESPVSSVDLSNTSMQAPGNPTTSQAVLGSSRVLSDAQIVQIAEAHNDFLRSITASLGGTSYTEGSQIIEAIHSGTMNLANQEQISIDTLSLPSSYADLDSTMAFVRSVGSPALIQVIDSASAFLESPAFTDFSSVTGMTNQLRTYAHLNIIGEELDAALTYLAVMDSSAYYWLDPSLGGEGGAQQFGNNVGATSQASAKNQVIRLGSVIGGDAGAAIGGIIKNMINQDYADGWTLIKRVGLGTAVGSAIAAGIDAITFLFGWR